jgi:hypothetical protein
MCPVPRLLDDSGAGALLTMAWCLVLRTAILQDADCAHVHLTADDNLYNIVDDPYLMVND